MKKKTRKLQLSRETLAHLRGGSNENGGVEASQSYCMPDCITLTSANIFVCRDDNTFYTNTTTD